MNIPDAMNIYSGFLRYWNICFLMIEYLTPVSREIDRMDELGLQIKLTIRMTMDRNYDV